MIYEKIYQEIYDELYTYLTPDWEKLIVYLEYGEGSYSFSFYEKSRNGYCNGYDLPGVKEKEIDRSFRRIDKLILRERKKETDNIWTNMTMVVTKTGTMHADFDYTDLSNGTYQFKKKWKKKYLK